MFLCGVEEVAGVVLTSGSASEGITVVFPSLVTNGFIGRVFNWLRFTQVEI